MSQPKTAEQHNSDVAELSQRVGEAIMGGNAAIVSINQQLTAVAERLSAIENRLPSKLFAELASVEQPMKAMSERFTAIEEGQKQMELRLGAYIRGLKSAQSQSNQELTGKQRRRKKR